MLNKFTSKIICLTFFLLFLLLRTPINTLAVSEKNADIYQETYIPSTHYEKFLVYQNETIKVWHIKQGNEVLKVAEFIPHQVKINGTWYRVNTNWQPVPNTNDTYEIKYNYFQVIANKSLVRTFYNGSEVSFVPLGLIIPGKGGLSDLRLTNSCNSITVNGSVLYCDISFKKAYRIPPKGTFLFFINATLVLNVSENKLEKKIIIWNSSLPPAVFEVLGSSIVYSENLYYKNTTLHGLKFDKGIKIVPPYIQIGKGAGKLNGRGPIKLNTNYEISNGKFKVNLDWQSIKTLLDASGYPIVIDPSLEYSTSTTVCGDIYDRTTGELYDQIVVDEGVTLTVCAYDGNPTNCHYPSTGTASGCGYVNFTTTNTHYSYIEINGTIDASGKGYRGGAKKCNVKANGNPGEGPGGGGGGHYYTYKSVTGGGGGGGYGSSGGDGGNAEYNRASGGDGGSSYGNSGDYSFYLGSGGGGSGSWTGYCGGGGGNGGGGVFIQSNEIFLNGNIYANGNDGSEDYVGAGGGGSGGTILLVGGVINTSVAKLEAKGGNGSPKSGIGSGSGGGGGGAGGRIKIFYKFQCSGSPTYSVNGGSGGQTEGYGYSGESGMSGTFTLTQDTTLDLLEPLPPNEPPSVDEPKTYDENLNPKTSFNAGETMRIRVNVSDPQGASDIDKVLITILDNSSTVMVNNETMVDVSSITNGYTYEYNYTIPSSGVSGLWTIKVYANDTQNAWGYNETAVTVTVDVTPPTITFISQTPSNLNVSSTDPVSIIVNITDESGIDTSKIAFFNGVNHTLTSSFYHYNWTWRYPANALQPDMRRADNRNMSYWFENVVFKENPDDIWTFAGYDPTMGEVNIIENESTYVTLNVTFFSAQMMFPQVFPFDKQYLTAENKTGKYVELCKNAWLKIRFHPKVFYNYTTENYTVYIDLDIDPSFTPNQQPLDIYFCNSSYISGDPGSSPYCSYVDHITSADERKIKINQSSYIQKVFSTHDGYVDGVAVSDTAYFVLKTNVPEEKSFRLYYANESVNQYINFSAFNNAWLSTDQGSSWSLTDWTPDFYLISTQAERDKVMYYVYACDVAGNCANSTIQYDSLDPANHPPNAPLIEAPKENETITGLYNITWYAIGDPDFDNYNYTIYLCNPDGSINDTIVADQPAQLFKYNYSYEFNSSVYPTGNYRINITLCDSHGACSSSITPYNFTIYHTYSETSTQALKISNIPQLISHQLTKSFQPLTIPSIASLYASQKIASPQAFSLTSLAQLISHQFSKSTQSFTLPTLITTATHTKLSQPFTLTSLSTLHAFQKISGKQSLNIPSFASLHALRKIIASQPFTLSHLLKILTASHTSQEFSITHLLTTSTHLHQPQKINIIDLASTYAFQKAFGKQTFTLTHAIKTLTGKNVYLKLIFPTVVSHISHYFVTIPQLLQMLFEATGKVYPVIVTIELPNGHVYGQNETVLVTGWVGGTNGNPYPYATVYLYYYKTSEGLDDAQLWAQTTTNATGYYNFTWYNPTADNYTLFVNITQYKNNQTNVEIINPINFTDESPDKWLVYYTYSRTFYDQLQKIKAFRPISSINFTTSRDDIAQPYYMSAVHGSYSNCNNIEPNDTCYNVFRFSVLGSNTYTFTTTANIYYKLGGYFKKTFSKTIHFITPDELSKEQKLIGSDEVTNISADTESSYSATKSCGGDTYYIYDLTNFRNVTLILNKSYDTAVVLINVGNGDLDASQVCVRYYINNQTSYEKCWSPGGCVYRKHPQFYLIFENNSVKNISVSFSHGAVSAEEEPAMPVKHENITLKAYYFNKTKRISFGEKEVYCSKNSECEETLYSFSEDPLSYFGSIFFSYHENTKGAYDYNNYGIQYTDYDKLNGNTLSGASWGSGADMTPDSRVAVVNNTRLETNNQLSLYIDTRGENTDGDIKYHADMILFQNDIKISVENYTLPENMRSYLYQTVPVFIGRDTNVTFRLENIGGYDLSDGYVDLILPTGVHVRQNHIHIPAMKSGDVKYVTFTLYADDIDPLRGFGLDSFWVNVNTTDGGLGLAMFRMRIIPYKNADVVIQAPDRVQAGGLFSIYSTFTPKDYSIFYPHVMLDLDGTFGFETGVSSANIGGGYTSGRCFDITLTIPHYEPGYPLHYQTLTTSGTHYYSDSLQMVPQHKYYIYDEYGFLNKSRGNNSYEIGKILTGYGIIQPGDWKMYGVYDFVVNGFSAEVGTIYSDYDLGKQLLYKFLDVTEVPQSLNIISGPDYGVIQGGTGRPARQDYNWIAWYPKNFPLYPYVDSEGHLYWRIIPYKQYTYYVPCLSAGYSPLVPPFNVYIMYVKSGDSAFSVPAGQRLAIVDNQVVEPGQTAEGVYFKAIAPLKPGIYNITVILWDDAETGLYWTATKQVRVVQYLPKSQIVVSQEDQPAEEVWAKQVGSDINVTMIRKVLVTNYEGFNDTQVSWVANPLPPDAVWINGSVAGTIDYICDSCTVNPSNITFKVPGVSYWYSIAFDSDTADLGSNVTGKINAYFYDNSTSTDFTNVKVNVTAMLLPDASTPTPTYTIDRIYTQQTIFRQFDWTSRTGYEKTWKIEKPNNYRYTATIHMYNNNSENLTVRYRIPLVRLPEFDPNRIISMSLDGENNLGYELTSTDLIILANNLTEGDHNFYLEYSPKPAVSLVTGGGAVGVAPNITVEPKHYNYTGKPTNFTAWFSVTCKDRACALIVVPSGPYSSWVEIPHEARYGWTTTGFLSIPRGATLVIPARVSIPEATPDGSYNITLLFSDIPTRVQTKAYIHLHITRKTPWEKYKPYIIIGLAIVILVVLVKLKIVRFK